ncbi:hypothetical protein HYFRA_00004615 [Hymenoscyphus fraxineus]|uniref:2EXR domain-containing protein n=1 Tax=Hymenoscyphus fraxineus TaxID=746836 RepID=A0A9N9KXP1_9HELO|nr:hypothetical protein HYFRA_00004615 [Hymenoscyphus fraxineus]
MAPDNGVIYQNDSGVAVPADGLKDINDMSSAKRDFDFDTSHRKKFVVVTASPSMIDKIARLNSALDLNGLLESTPTVNPLASELLSKPNAIAKPDAVITKADTFKVPETFPYFPNLPLELQRIIWVFALPDSRLFPLVNWRKPSTKNGIETPPEDATLHLIPHLETHIVPSLLVTCHIKDPIPSILHACHESRRIAKKHYIETTVYNDFSEGFFIDWEVDVLHGSPELFLQLLGTAVRADFFDDRLGMSNLEFVAQVRHISFSGVVAPKAVLDLLAGYMPLFERLESITVEQGGDGEGEGEGEGLSVARGWEGTWKGEGGYEIGVVGRS